MGLVWSEGKLFSLHLSVFVTIRHGRLRDGPLGLWEPSPLLGSALVGANKSGPCLQICRYMEEEGGGGSDGGDQTLLKSAESWDVTFI